MKQVEDGRAVYMRNADYNSITESHAEILYNGTLIYSDKIHMISSVYN